MEKTARERITQEKTIYWKDSLGNLTEESVSIVLFWV
jgi:hypothetical protein